MARRGIRELVTRGLVTPVAPSGTYGVWTRSAAAEKAEAAAKAERAAKGEVDKKPVKRGNVTNAKAAAKAAEKAEREAAAALDE